MATPEYVSHEHTAPSSEFATLARGAQPDRRRFIVWLVVDAIDADVWTSQGVERAVTHRVGELVGLEVQSCQARLVEGG